MIKCTRPSPFFQFFRGESLAAITEQSPFSLCRPLKFKGLPKFGPDWITILRIVMCPNCRNPQVFPAVWLIQNPLQCSHSSILGDDLLFKDGIYRHVLLIQGMEYTTCPYSRNVIHPHMSFLVKDYNTALFWNTTLPWASGGVTCPCR